VLQCVGERILTTEATLQTSTHSNKLQHAATRCNTLQHTSGAGQLGQEDTDNRGDAANEMADNLVAVNIGPGRYRYTLQHTATHCNTLQHAATHCDKLQY